MAIFPIDVVLPTPLTPTTKITWGLFVSKEKVLLSSESQIIFMISSFKIKSNSDELRNLSLATLSSIWSIIFNVVFTPTSELIKISSKLSKTWSSTLLLPITTLEILLKKDSLLFFKPLSKDSFFSF